MNALHTYRTMRTQQIGRLRMYRTATPIGGGMYRVATAVHESTVSGDALAGWIASARRDLPLFRSWIR